MEKVGIPGLFFRQIKKVDTRINTYYNIFTGNKMTASEIKKLLKKAGFEIIAGAKHDKAIHSETGKMITIPRHKGDIAKGTVFNILKEAGIN